MTILISVVGVIGRAAGGLLTSALGWASSLLFGRVPRSHQVFVTLLMAGSFLWVAMILATLVPGVAPFLLDATPHPGFIGISLVRFVILTGLLFLPIGVGLAGYLVPAQEDRPTGLAAVRQLVGGYPLALLMSGILIFLAGVGIARRVRNWRHRWSDAHIPIVVKPGGYEQMVTDLQAALEGADLRVTAHDAPRILSVPGKLLSKVGVGNIGSLVPDRLVQLIGPEIEIGLYPSDIAISGGRKERTRARAVIMSRLVWTSAHVTTSAEAQAIEDRLEHVEQLAEGRSPKVRSPVPTKVGAELAAIDRTLLDADLATDEWDILYRLRLQVERDVLAGTGQGTHPGSDRPAGAPPRVTPTPEPVSASR